MFNIYSFERKVQEEDKTRQDIEKDKKVMSSHRKMRDIMAENYQRRVAMFIREMVDSPVEHTDEYTMRTTILSAKNRNKFKSMEFSSIGNDDQSTKNTTKTMTSTKRTHNQRYRDKSVKNTTFSSFQQPTPDFRFASYRTEKERIENNIKYNQQFCDSVPNPDKFIFHKTLRARDESKDVGPQFRFTAKSGVERVYDQLNTRITSAFQARELASDKLQSTIRHRRQNQTISPKQLLPSIHHKTHFKAATSVFLKSELENSLKDKSNYLSRALRDVSPSFTNMSVDNLTERHMTSPANKTPSIIKLNKQTKSVSKAQTNQNVSFQDESKVTKKQSLTL